MLHIARARGWGLQCRFDGVVAKLRTAGMRLGKKRRCAGPVATFETMATRSALAMEISTSERQLQSVASRRREHKCVECAFHMHSLINELRV